jgi:hypothetical protein
MSNEIQVEVAYALPQQQLIVKLKVPQGTTAEEAVLKSGLMQKFPEISLAQNKLGIFGKAAKNDHVLRENDRVEIYRGLIADPKGARRARAAEGKAPKKAEAETPAPE